MEASKTGNIRTKKAILRSGMLKKRSALGKDERAVLSERICAKFLDSDCYRNASTIFLYKAYNNEVDTDAIFDKAISDGKTVAYPLSSLSGGEPELCFYVITDHSQLIPGFKGIYEPDVRLGLEKSDGKCDICITPGAVFDRKCHRIGYGKAFYDRFIRQSKPQTVVGLAFEVQMTEEFETEESDRPVDMVITDSAVYKR